MVWVGNLIGKVGFHRQGSVSETAEDASEAFHQVPLKSALRRPLSHAVRLGDRQGPGRRCLRVFRWQYRIGWLIHRSLVLWEYKEPRLRIRVWYRRFTLPSIVFVVTLGK